MFWERFYAMCEMRGTKPNPVGAAIGVSSAAITKWKNGAVPNGEILSKLADYLDCSVDYLLGRTDEINGSADTFDPQLTAKDERDIAKQLDAILDGMSKDALMFDGEPLDEETKELLRASLDSTLRMAKIAAKKKFTPKKYRK